MLKQNRWSHSVGCLKAQIRVYSTPECKWFKIVREECWCLVFVCLRVHSVQRQGVIQLLSFLCVYVFSYSCVLLLCVCDVCNVSDDRARNNLPSLASRVGACVYLCVFPHLCLCVFVTSREWPRKQCRRSQRPWPQESVTRTRSLCPWPSSPSSLKTISDV